jgi:hypothetical protein
VDARVVSASERIYRTHLVIRSFELNCSHADHLGLSIVDFLHFLDLGPFQTSFHPGCIPFRSPYASKCIKAWWQAAEFSVSKATINFYYNILSKQSHSPNQQLISSQDATHQHPPSSPPRLQLHLGPPSHQDQEKRYHCPLGHRQYQLRCSYSHQ